MTVQPRDNGAGGEHAKTTRTILSENAHARTGCFNKRVTTVKCISHSGNGPETSDLAHFASGSCR